LSGCSTVIQPQVEKLKINNVYALFRKRGASDVPMSSLLFEKNFVTCVGFWVEKKAGLGKGGYRWLVENGVVDIQHGTRLELFQTMEAGIAMSS
jgi:hypothetical protein